MRISEAEALRRLGSSSNLTRLAEKPLPSSEPSPTCEDTRLVTPHPSGEAGIIHNTIKHGRKGSTELPEFLRDTIGGLAIMPGHQPQHAIAKAFGISREAVSDYATGKVGGRPATAERAAKVEERIGVIKDTALTKLMSALNLCSDEKLEDLSAKELGRFANDMSRVVTSVSPQDSNRTPVNLIIYSPEQKTEQKYKVIDV